ncbi:SigE family RNA polymerase sigma factor [Asanoa iriomotensis]|uniref:DNA-directed RNA polymerase sigma-70 factor n=1 Tax=Asanoa iriomotensis TaxID=234613 RepID=A0ABQ4BZN5_9ACTN|nr:SigE family RNA polymerase sigma factor [Asanoa iriomotensis]GIF55972.1 DNA-directed RNA polymerase sigma-70 factor [Asanoa iriomotensis]
MRDDDGFDEFVRGNGHRLVQFATLLTGGDRSAADDLVSEGLARLYVSWSRVRSADAFSYARRTVVNLHTDWWRRRRRRPEVPTERLPETSIGGHDGDIASRDSVTRALRELTRRERGVVVLRYFADLTEQETARELGISLGTVKSTNARALAKLRVSPELVDPFMANITNCTRERR